MSTQTYTKGSLINALLTLKAKGWIEATRNQKNAGAIGNTLEDLLGIEENNLPIPNAAEWELKTQCKNTNSLVTLFHMEPSPRALKIVPYLLNRFGWRHDQAGSKYPQEEKSFRQTLSYHNITTRGFDLDIHEESKKIFVSFDFNAISPDLAEWQEELLKRNSTRLDENYTPYWGLNDVFHQAGVKLNNCFYVIADEKTERGKRFIRYENILMLSDFKIENLVAAIKNKHIYVDFDARTGHNHGTKFRLKAKHFPELYHNVERF